MESNIVIQQKQFIAFFLPVNARFKRINCLQRMTLESWILGLTPDAKAGPE